MLVSQNRKKQRKVEYLEPISTSYYIFCEGEKTEPFYFRGFKDLVVSNSIYKNMTIEIEGLGYNTNSLLEKAEEYVASHHLKDAQIWCVYDKDEFPDDNFNKVEQRMSGLNTQNKDNVTYHAAWSNQCIEYWFILHFSFYDANNDRQYYVDFLKKKFKDLGRKPYAKNDKGVFDVLCQYGNPKQAMRWADKQLEGFQGITPAKSAPATKVHLLVRELAKYFPSKAKERFV